MQNQIETAPTVAEMEAALAALELFCIRQDETARAVAAAPNAFEAYWADSASASVMRDCAAGRVVVLLR